MRVFISWCAAGVLLARAFAPAEANGQATVVDAPDTVFVLVDTMSATGYVAAQWDVVNETDAALNLMVTRSFGATATPFNYPFVEDNPGSYERFCWGTSCFDYGQNASTPPANVLLNPGDTTSTFVSDFYPNNVTGSTTIRYCFHEPAELTSGVCHAVTFVVLGTVGLEEPTTVKPTLAHMVPNPAQDEVMLSFDHAKNGVLEFRNLIGQVSHTEQVSEGLTEHRVSLDGLADGVWLVTYKVDGVAASTKRLVIR